MPKNTPLARAKGTAFDEVELTFPYNGQLVEAIKEIPYVYRRWIPTEKAWRISGPYRDRAVRLLLEFFPDAEVTRFARPQPPANGGAIGGDHFAVLHLLPSAPIEVVNAAFRALAKCMHPDHGGTDAAMRRLTEAHETLNRRLSA